MSKAQTDRHRRVRDRQIAHIGVPLWTASQAFVGAMFARVQSQGFEDISPGDADLLPHLDIEGTSVTTLGLRRGVSRQAAHQSVHSLVRRGYLSLEPDPDDRRAKIVRYTEKGLDLLEALQGVKGALQHEAEQALGARDMARLESLLGKVSAVLAAAADGDSD